MNRRAWTQQEDQAISELVSKIGTKHWSYIARQLTNKYSIKGRSGKQCRQRWHNHINREISKKPWSEKEEKILFSYHKTYGNKWIQISKHLQFRTQNSIKNHFYSTLRKSLRKMNKVLGSKSSSLQMKNIKPSVLSQILINAQSNKQKQIPNTGSQNIYNFEDLANSLLQFAFIKQKKIKELKVKTEGSKQKIEELLMQIVKFNSEYQRDKAEKIKMRRSMFYLRNQIINSAQSDSSANSVSQVSIQQNQNSIEQKLDSQFDMVLDQIQLKQQIIELEKIDEDGIIKLIYNQQEQEKQILLMNQNLQNEQKIQQQQLQIQIQIDDQVFDKSVLKETLFDLSLNMDFNSFQALTPRLQNRRLFSPRLPTPTSSFLRSNQSKLTMMTTEQQIQKKLAQLKNQLSIYQQELRLKKLDEIMLREQIHELQFEPKDKAIKILNEKMINFI